MFLSGPPPTPSPRGGAKPFIGIYQNLTDNMLRIVTLKIIGVGYGVIFLIWPLPLGDGAIISPNLEEDLQMKFF